MATQSNILDWEILWAEEPSGLQSLGSQRVGHSLTTKQQHISFYALWTELYPLNIHMLTSLSPCEYIWR